MRLWPWGWFRFTPGLTPGLSIFEPDRTLADLDDDEDPVEEWLTELKPDQPWEGTA